MNEQIRQAKELFYNERDNYKYIIPYMNPLYNPYYKETNQYREVAFLNKPNGKDYQKIAFRGITFTTDTFLKKTLDMQDFINNDANIYTSVAIIKQLPLFSFKHGERIIQTKPFFENEFKNYIIRKDVFIDTDLEEKKIKKDTYTIRLYKYVELIILLDSFNINFETAFSGSRGFKTLIYNENNIIKDTSIFLHKLACFFYKLPYTQKNVLNITKRNDNIFDLVGCNIPSKLMKCTNTLCISGDKKIRFVLPIFEDDFSKIFNLMLKYKYDIFEDILLCRMNIKQYGIKYIFRENKNNIENLNKFIEVIERGYNE